MNTCTDSVARHAIARLAARLASGQRVLWVGPDFGEAERGVLDSAAQVRAYLGSRPGLKSERFRARPLRVDALRPRPGSADLVVVADVSCLGDACEAALEPLLRAAGEHGAVLVAGMHSGEREPRWFPRLREHGEVASFGCAEVGGWTLAPLSSQPAEVVISDERDQDAAWIVAVAGADGARIPAEVELVLMPRRERERAPAKRDDGELRQAAQSDRVAAQRISGLESELEGLRASHQEAMISLGAEHEKALAKAEEALQEAEATVASLEEAVEKAQHEVAPVEKSAEVPEASGQAPQQDYDLLEEKLQDRAERVRELEVELGHSNRLVRDLLEEMGRRDRKSSVPASVEVEAATDSSASVAASEEAREDAERQVTAARGELLEVRSLLAGALIDPTLAESDPFAGAATVVGMDAPDEWEQVPPAGMDELRARLGWVRSESTVGGDEGPAPDGPIQLGTMPPEATTGSQLQDRAMDDELVRLHQRLAELDDEVEQERHRRESLEVEVQRLEGEDSMESLRELKGRLEALSRDAASMSATGEAPEMQRLADLLRELADR